MPRRYPPPPGLLHQACHAEPSEASACNPGEKFFPLCERPPSPSLEAVRSLPRACPERSRRAQPRGTRQAPLCSPGLPGDVEGRLWSVLIWDANFPAGGCHRAQPQSYCAPSPQAPAWGRAASAGSLCPLFEISRNQLFPRSLCLTRS